jgi:hypothetical protein
MHVNESRCEHQTGGVDGSVNRRPIRAVGADIGDPIVVDQNVGAVARVSVPSTTVAERISVRMVVLGIRSRYGSGR